MLSCSFHGKTEHNIERKRQKLLYKSKLVNKLQTQDRYEKYRTVRNNGRWIDNVQYYNNICRVCRSFSKNTRTTHWGFFFIGFKSRNVSVVYLCFFFFCRSSKYGPIKITIYSRFGKTNGVGSTWDCRKTLSEVCDYTTIRRHFLFWFPENINVMLKKNNYEWLCAEHVSRWDGRDGILSLFYTRKKTIAIRISGIDYCSG